MFPVEVVARFAAAGVASVQRRETLRLWCSRGRRIDVMGIDPAGAELLSRVAAYWRGLLKQPPFGRSRYFQRAGL